MLFDMKRVVLEACVLIAFGALCGLTLNHQLVMDAFTGTLVSQQPSGVATDLLTVMPMPVLIDEVQDVKNSGGLIVDARSPELYTLHHIEGAVSLPMVEVESVLPDFMARFDKEQTLITYCSGFGCPDSFDLALRLVEEGFLDVRVFERGFPEWRDAGLPVAGENR